MSAGIVEQTVNTVTMADAQALVWIEAEMLDTLDYKGWLALWTADGLYIVPADRDVTDHAASLNILYDNAAMREARVKRFRSGFSMSSAPPARTVRTVGRFVVKDAGNGYIELKAAQILVEYKYGRSRVLAADVDYRLETTTDGLKIARKVVTLINADDPLHGIGYLL